MKLIEPGKRRTILPSTFFARTAARCTRIAMLSTGAPRMRGWKRSL